jgi:hypothetical protein
MGRGVNFMVKKENVLFKIVGYAFLLVGCLLIGIFLLVNYLFFNIDRLPEGELLVEEISPTGTYTVLTYINNGHSTVAPAVRGEVVYHNKNDKKRNLYWAYRTEEGKIEWVNEHVASINGLELDVRRDSYDFRKD